jgi:hypothetical protein
MSRQRSFDIEDHQELSPAMSRRQAVGGMGWSIVSGETARHRTAAVAWCEASE